jgi:RNA polymerase sigma factor (sigma-70 family)
MELLARAVGLSLRYGKSFPIFEEAAIHAPVDAKDHLRLAWFVAGRLSGWAARRGVDFDDLVQEAALAVVRAAQRFDPARGFTFSTYAYPTVEWTLIRAIRRHWPVHGLPGAFDRPAPDVADVDTVDEVNRLLAHLPDRERLAVVRRFGLDGGEELTHAEVGTLLGVSGSRAGQIIMRGIAMMRDARR